MSDKEINESLYNLRNAIQGISENDQEARDTLEDLLDKLEDKLESASDESHLHIVVEMKESLTQFEVEHPSITAILNQLMVTLGGLGI